MHTNSFDEALALPTEEAVQVALRTQQIIAHESGVANTVDPLGGSYYIEWLTNEIGDISPLASLTNLTSLWLQSNQINDISPLENLTNLTLLKLWSNQISDISPLVENSGLGTGDQILLYGNNLDISEDSEDMEDIKALEDRGVDVGY